MIRVITQNDHDVYIAMAKEFYASDAVLHNIEPINFENTFSELMRSDTYTKCYMLQTDNTVCGYALLAKTFSQEAGGMVLWLEELYIRPEYRSKGLGSEFFDWISKNKDPDVKRLRLEIEPENERAVMLYKRWGFNFFDYAQMIAEL